MVHLIQIHPTHLQARKHPVIRHIVLITLLQAPRLMVPLIRVVVGILIALQIIMAALRLITLPILPLELCLVQVLLRLLPENVPADFTG